MKLDSESWRDPLEQRHWIWLRADDHCYCNTKRHMNLSQGMIKPFVHYQQRNKQTVVNTIFFKETSQYIYPILWSLAYLIFQLATQLVAATILHRDIFLCLCFRYLRIYENKREQLSSREGDLCVAQNRFQPPISAHEKDAMSDHKKNTERKNVQVN
jgi:hypothetical protein